LEATDWNAARAILFRLSSLAGVEHATSHAGYDREIDRMILEVHVITGAALSSGIAHPFSS
jgi:hypothetical protein